MKQLNQNKNVLTKQQYKTLKGQVVAGDVDGANKGLIKILQRGY
ncbi:Uncharacterised protein [Clostridium putrefaciens]|uniref:Uncharacterized protein n=2 Tax=Clostridium TaxID=1485 RepID=A0A381J8V2_9CLOT|nr:hypothetical protein BD821_12125 [Clostridium algidicarnis DSM 15099]SUY47714.1 Uncharacterised protein [Clostridium putrefaciens]